MKEVLNLENLKSEYKKLKSKTDSNITDWWIDVLKGVGFEHEIDRYNTSPILRYRHYILIKLGDGIMEWSFNISF